MMSFPLNALGRPPKDKSAPRPFHLEESTLDWLERIKARPAFKAAEERRIEEEKKQAP
jgi:hypothetical protein